MSETTENQDAGGGFAPAAGWVVHGERMNPETGNVLHFRSPPEPHGYPEEVANRMAVELKDAHPSWVWSVVPPNDKVSDAP